MGDEVNLASRLEGVNKEYGTHIIISESTWERVRDRIATRELDIIQVKGRTKPTRIFEVLGFLPLPDDQAQEVKLFEEGIRAYRLQRWQDAIRLFNQTLQNGRDDYPCRVYIERCEEFLVAPPSPEWDGVYTMKTK
jgi:adenylate cyclase